MLPQVSMLAIKKRRMSNVQVPLPEPGPRLCAFCSWTLWLALLLVCGCTPPGPRALLKGQRLIQEGKYEQAIESLQTAVRLLPKNAQAYNHLGLAWHGNRQFGPALVAYQKALVLDHNLAAARFNLGCLLLEQNDPAAAIEHLTTFTMLQPASVDGWLKLGNAQLRAHKLDAAEKAYKTVLAQYPRHPEVLNGLGVIQLQRKRPQEALSYFNFAIAQNPNYAPALLNAAVLNQQSLNNRQTALEKYRQYLALVPRPANWDAVATLASRLDAELNPAPVRLAQANPTLAPPVRSNVPASISTPVVKSNLTASLSPPVRTNLTASSTPPGRAASNHPPAVVAIPTLHTNPPPATATPATSPPRIVAQTNQAFTNPFAVALAKPLIPEPAKPPTPPPPKPSEIEVTRVPDELVVQPPQEILVVRPPILPTPGLSERPSAKPTNSAPSVLPNTDSKPDKRGLFSRLNPFGGKPKSSTKEKAPVSPPETPKPDVIVVAARTPTNTIMAATPAPAPVVFPRYSYLSPAKPVPGNRREAERFFAEGIRSQQSGRPSQALAAYQRATQLDPAYFEAYYNQGLAAYGMANWKESLADYERALAIKPNSLDARYNFALALQQASYPLDAAEELLEILNERQAETRAHLLLANLYARQLNQPKLARQSYLKVLEQDPHHPKAAEIRYWLAANP